jgi:hypothetical protein
MVTSSDKNVAKLELHYFFYDQSHSMDAVVRNKCEYELLSLFREISTRLDIKIDLETEALGEGGIKEVWNFLGKNSSQLSVVLLATTLILSRVPTTNERLEQLKETELNLSIEEKKLNIEKLKKEIQDSDSEKIDIERLLEIINDYLKIKKHKSNFYSHLMSYNKVSQIITKGLDENYQEIIPEKIVKRKDFYKFILQTDELPVEIDEDAIIEIISPVLKTGNYKWKGLYDNEPIPFYMKDKDFKNSIIRDGIKFKNGTIIECVLEKSRKIDNMGEIIISGYSVNTVVKKSDDSESFVTPQGEKYKKIKKEKKRQYKLFKDQN